MTMDIKNQSVDEIVVIDGVAYKKVADPLSRATLLSELEHETQFMAKTTQDQYMVHCIDYLDFVQGHKLVWNERATVYKYIDLLTKKRHLSQSTVDYIIRGPVGALFRMYDLKLPVKLPPMKHGNVIDIASRLSFSYEEIVDLILTAKNSGNHQWQNIMVLSSIYMLRAGEIRAIKPSDVHPVKKTIVIQTEKGGMLREHFVPPEIAPYIFNYDYPQLPRLHLFNAFNELAAAAGVDRTDKHKGIHAVRHGVKTVMDELRDENDMPVFDKNDTFRFGRWKGIGQGEAYVTPNFQALDKLIFKRHPFLKYWA